MVIYDFMVVSAYNLQKTTPRIETLMIFRCCWMSESGLYFLWQRKPLWAVGKDFNAEATESELSWATGSGLPICCISGLAVAEEGRGVDARPWRKPQSPNFLGTIIEFLQSGSVDIGDRREDKQTARQKWCVFVGEKPLKGMNSYGSLELQPLIFQSIFNDTCGYCGNINCSLILHFWKLVTQTHSFTSAFISRPN